MSSNYQLILDALDDYAKQNGIDLDNNPFAEKLRSCRSPGDVLDLLEDKAKAFKDFREGDRKLIEQIRPVVNVLHAFSRLFGGAAELVSRRDEFA